MGVENLSYFLKDATPDAIITDQKLNDYSGKVIAMDAFQYLYQSMSSRRKRNRSEVANLKESGSSPLLRTFYSCIKLLEHHIKPIYVFDGSPPKLKAPILKQRSEKRKEAAVELKQAEKDNNLIQVEYFKKKTVKVGKTEVKNCKGLLKLLGIPTFYAPGEAEAQCAAFVESGIVYASATQDLDALIYGSKVVLRHLPLYHNHNAHFYPLEEIHLDKVLNRLQLSLPEFIDLSILLGCDYCQGIKGLGAHKALELIHKHRSIENILDHLDTNRFSIPNEWLFKEARLQFQNPNVMDRDKVKEFVWKEPDVEGVVKYLDSESNFNEKEIRKAFNRIHK